ncbi:hypothetical protein R3W88_025883 [Solanum pinnatisectum]|uniref:RNase H type-1 domain-containing protein n=1 Tax=Solanum pinnatisectum TaxID=50273 RepID=A0AAV9M4C2_9SOLN|nr:hypothetical protein R3W88_025883 [Solanum pinnatisectum]
MAIDMNVHELLVIGDSDLLIHQVQGEWAVKNPKITPYVQYIQKLCKRFRRIEFRHTPRIQNELADALATIASMIKHPDTNSEQYRTSIGATPYLLVYGTEAVIPAEVEMPSLRIIQEAELDNADWICKRIDQLTLIDEKRMVAVCHGQLYRQRMIRAFHKKVRARTFEVGQLVLKRIFPHQDEYKGKFSPNWQGPYLVRKVLPGGALILSEMDGIEWPKPINSDAVKRYYV